jgi:hypothetical protein
MARLCPAVGARVERIHGVQQDRLIKKLRGGRKSRVTKPANEYLGTQYLPEHNPTLCPAGGQAGGLSRAEADRPRTAPDLPLGDRAHDQQRLGDPARRPLSATTWAAALWTHAKQGSSLRMGGRSHRGVLPRGAGSLHRAEGVHTKTSSANSARRQSHCGEES